MKIAIVTGASSGLGKEFLRRIGLLEELDEIWAVARREEALEHLSVLTATPVTTFPLDLTKQTERLKLKGALEEKQPDVRWLISTAGIGKMGTYEQVGEDDCREIIRLNCEASVEVAQMALPYMEAGANILEVCSSSAFQPLPGLNVYAASKAFLLHYSRALRWELFSREINVTALCPYWMWDTEFIEKAKSGDPEAIRHFPLAMSKGTVAKKALQDTKNGRAVSTPGLVSPLQRIFAKLLPSCVAIGAWELLRRL